MFQQLADRLAPGLGSDIFLGGLALGLLGVAAGLAGLAARRVLAFALRRVSVSLTLDNRSAAYGHFLLWLEREGGLDHARRRHVAHRPRGASGEAWLPAPGRHWFRRGARLCLLDRSVNERARTHAHGGPLEMLEITLVFGGLAVLRGWIAEGAALAAAETRLGPRLQAFRHDYWEELGIASPRSLATVLCDDGRLVRLLEDLRWFYGAEGWYAARGLPWRRGVLLYGPPGTGKSSAVRALASELELDLAIVDLGRRGLGDDGLMEAMATAPARALLLMEDIDAAFSARAAGEGAAEGLTFSGLLNAIDGVAAQEGRALVMTTNHRERLDPALIRPGRADLQVELGPVSAATAARLFSRFHPGEAALARRFEAALGEARVTPAAVQGWLLEHLDNPARAAGAEGLVRPAALSAIR